MNESARQTEWEDVNLTKVRNSNLTIGKGFRIGLFHKLQLYIKAPGGHQRKESLKLQVSIR